MLQTIDSSDYLCNLNNYTRAQKKIIIVLVRNKPVLSIAFKRKLSTLT